MFGFGKGHQLPDSIEFLSKIYSDGMSLREASKELQNIRNKLIPNPFGLPDDTLRSVSDFFENFEYPAHPFDRLDDNLKYYGSNYLFILYTIILLSNPYASCLILGSQYVSVIIPINSFLNISVPGRLCLIHSLHCGLYFYLILSCFMANFFVWVASAALTLIHAFFRTRSKLRVAKTNIQNASDEIRSFTDRILGKQSKSD